MAFNSKPNSVFFMESICAANLVLKESAAIVLNSGVVLYLS